MNPEQKNTEERSSNPSETPKAVDPRDLVNKPGYIANNNPEEVLGNPAVTPEMVDEKNNRGDLKRE